MVIVVNRKGYTVLELLVVIILFGVLVAFTISKTAYSFENDTTEYYEVTMKSIESNAKRYAESLEELKSSETKIITVKDLVSAGYLEADNKNGDIIDPRNSNSTLNNVKIKLTYDEDKGYKATVIEEK